MDAAQRQRVGGQIRTARKMRGWSQEDLAREAEVSANTVVAAESGRKRTQDGKLRAILDALDIDPTLSEALPLADIPEDVRTFLTVALQRLKVMPESKRARVLADIYPRLMSN